LIRQSLRDIEANPERFGSASRPDLLGSGARTYHISFSRRRAGSPGVKEPRHFLLYRRKRDPKDGQDVVEIARILHDSTDLARHLPPDYRREN
jgi:toxin ParE1/3/4